MKKIHIIGIGSYWGDDYAGWYVCEKLVASTKLQTLPKSGICIEKANHPSMALTLLEKKYPNVFLIDAVHSGQAPGLLHQLHPLQHSIQIHSVSSHGLGLGETIEIANSLGYLTDNLTLYGIEVGDINPLQNGLSPNIATACQRLVTRFENIFSTLAKQ